MNDDAISTNNNTRIIFNELPPPPLPPPDRRRCISINNLRMSIIVSLSKIKFVIPKVGVQIYRADIFQVHFVLLVREIIVAIHRRRICGQLN